MSDETPPGEFSKEKSEKLTGSKITEQLTDHFRTELFSVLTELVLLKHGTLNPDMPKGERNKKIEDLEVKESECLIKLAQCKGLLFQSN